MVSSSVEHRSKARKYIKNSEKDINIMLGLLLYLRPSCTLEAINPELLHIPA